MTNKIEQTEQKPVKKSRSGTPPAYSISVPKPIILEVKEKLEQLLDLLGPYGIASKSKLFYTIVLRGEVIDGQLVVNLGGNK